MKMFYIEYKLYQGTLNVDLYFSFHRIENRIFSFFFYKFSSIGREVPLRDYIIIIVN